MDIAIISSEWRWSEMIYHLLKTKHNAETVLSLNFLKGMDCRSRQMFLEIVLECATIENQALKEFKGHNRLIKENLWKAHMNGAISPSSPEYEGVVEISGSLLFQSIYFSPAGRHSITLVNNQFSGLATQVYIKVHSIALNDRFMQFENGAILSAI